MVLRKFKNCGLAALLVGAGLLGGCSESGYREKNVPVVQSETPQYSNETVKELVEVLGERKIKNLEELNQTPAEDLKMFVEIYRGNSKICEELREANPSEKELEKYKKTFPWEFVYENGKLSEKDRTAVVFYALKYDLNTGPLISF